MLLWMLFKPQYLQTFSLSRKYRNTWALSVSFSMGALLNAFLSLSCTQEDINITQEQGRVHIMGQTLKEKKGLLRNWILRDHGPGVRRGGGGEKGMERRRKGRELAPCIWFIFVI